MSQGRLWQWRWLSSCCCVELSGNTTPATNGVTDRCDNCPLVYNKKQRDIDKDHIGDVSCSQRRWWRRKDAGKGELTPWRRKQTIAASVATVSMSTAHTPC